MGYVHFQGAAVVNNLPATAGDARDVGLIPGLEGFSEVGNGSLLKYSCLGNPMVRWAWLATVQGVAKSQTHWAHTQNVYSYYFDLTYYIDTYLRMLF